MCKNSEKIYLRGELVDMAVNVNLAYEYPEHELIGEREEQYAERIRDKRSANKRRKNAASIRIFAGAVVVFGLFVAMIYGKVELTKLYSENTTLRSELQVLNDENVSLESELAQQTGLTRVEEYAETRLGLKKLDRSQIEYVEIKESTAAEPVANDDGNIFVKITDKWNDLMEYLGL